MLTMDAFGSHLAPLLGCVTRTDGRVLELGSGLYSTPVLHAAVGDRELLTADRDPVWMARFLYLRSATHRFEQVDDWGAWPALDEAWDVALVDHSPGHERAPAIARLRARARFIVVHDTNAVEHYGYEPLLSSFRHRRDFMELGLPIRTTVVSDLAPVPELVPEVTAGHRPLRLSREPVRLLTADRQWAGETFRLPRRAEHFLLTGEIHVVDADPTLNVQAVYLAGDGRELFFSDLLTTDLDPQGGTFAVAQELAQPVEERYSGTDDPDWTQVRSVALRAKADGGAEVRVEGFGLLAVVAERPDDVAPVRPL